MKADKLETAVQALRDIIDPIGKMRREMPEGHTLSGSYAAMMAESAEHLRGIAREALRKLGRVERVRAKRR